MVRRTTRLSTILICAALFVAAFGFPAPAHAETGSNWTGSYFANPNLAGTPVFSRIDPALVFNWGPNPPGPGIGINYWSATWTTIQFFTAGTYRFLVTADDGVRVYINGQRILDQWREQAPTTFMVDVNLATGTAAIQVDYFQGVGDASLIVSWSRLLTQSTAWTAQYFNNPFLAGAPVLSRLEPQIDHFWGLGSPDPRIVPTDRFSARYTATFPFNAATYRFVLVGDDGVRLWIDDILVIDQWKDQVATGYSIDVPLTAGLHTLRVEYYENVNQAAVRLTYSPAVGSPYAGQDNFWYGEYFTNMTLSGTPTLIRNDGRSGINFNWNAAAPAPGFPREYFSARWTRRICDFPGRPTQFTLITDDGARFYIDTTLIIDAWKTQSLTTYTRNVDLTSGCHDLRLEYFQELRESQIFLTWNPPDGQNPPLSLPGGNVGQPTGVTATVNTGVLNVRAAPSVSGAQLAQVTRGTFLTLTARNADGSWVRVITPLGVQGWVNARFLTLTAGSIFSLPDGTSGGISPTAPPITGVKGQLTSGLRLRAGPATSFAELGLVEWGTVVDIVGRTANNEWYQVRSGANVGWIFAPYVRIVQGNIFNVPITG
jgi:uncharacterized protein YraI